MAAIMSSRSGALTLSRPCKAVCPISRSIVKVQAYQVTLRMPSGKTRTLEVAPDEAIFDAIDRTDLDLPYLCRSGTCGTCAGRVQSGQVEQIGQHILDEHQIKAGFVLLCSSYPRSDCTILTHQEERVHTEYAKH
ncbi:hypothetical protein PLESTB_000357200 [Pleodorina starrii]|uniref:Ferredoxin n=1 Tax=Pleodorina starrii TaxID=330485 RepID=A0A9W6EYQ2_9CHLO|nr:hypothetical protein PLESTM_000038300 [Pleodorina starrii]GLC50233.1 hypothetical protein PLESTB_000357200 [Pleodorina starrii]GLC64387.1 hypothetical protein PLESTF_000155900 [Pleodorina starrii]